MLAKEFRLRLRIFMPPRDFAPYSSRTRRWISLVEAEACLPVLLEQCSKASWNPHKHLVLCITISHVEMHSFPIATFLSIVYCRAI